MKMVTNVCDGGSTVDLDPERPVIAIPAGYEKRSDARLIIPYTLALENEVNYRRLDAARDFARANGVNQIFGARQGARLGIATAGKPYYDLMQALRDLGIRSDELAGLGVRIAKFGMTFPLEPFSAAEFAAGLERILVIEEKRSFLELQLREALYNAAPRPLIVGKKDEDDRVLVPATAELDAEQISKVLARY
jgi:indolepyruvate ferredoxin oxidoreductase